MTRLPRDQLTRDELMHHMVRAAGPWEYFVRKVRIGLPQDCWEWVASCGTPGYGNWCHEMPGFPKVGAAHRRTYALFFEHPGDLQVNHRCGNSRCCNPDHLYAGTARQNWEDSVAHKTACTPPNFYGKESRNKYGYSSLDEDKVREIRCRRINGETGRNLAREYGVTESTICAIHKRKNWRWVD